MPPAAAQLKEQPADIDSHGINAVLLGPPGSGKGTQVFDIRFSKKMILNFMCVFFDDGQFACLNRHHC